MKMKEKARNIFTSHDNSYFSLRIAQIIPFPAFLGELTSYLRKTIFILVQKKGIYVISRKKILFTEKVNFLSIFCLFHFFSSNNNEKTLNIATIYFFLKKIINDVFLNVFSSTSGFLNKTFFLQV